MPPIAARPAVILLVEDDPGDQELTRRGLEASVLPSDLRIVADGEEALDYLLRRGGYRDPALSPRPGLILLDLNLPGTDGWEVLRRIKWDPSLRCIAVVVLTASQRQEDVARGYLLGCNTFITKPRDGVQFFNVAWALRVFWFEVATLPGAMVEA